MPRNVAVFGLGNVLLSDDALGPWVIRDLETRWSFPEGVVLADLGTPGLELSTHLAGCDVVILADAVAASDPVGTIHVYDRDAILRHPTGIRLGPHDPSLAETLTMMSLLDDGPREVTLIGAVPESTAPHIGLSGGVRDAIPRIAAAIVRMITLLGHDVTLLDSSAPVSAWWESDAGEAAFRIVAPTT